MKIKKNVTKEILILIEEVYFMQHLSQKKDTI